MNEKSYIQILEEKNKALAQKLEIAKDWMKKEVKERKIEIENDSFEDLATHIQKKINTFFSEILLINLNEEFIDNIISSEISFYQMQKDIHIDGMIILLWYQKNLDFLIEESITKEFRKFAIKQGLNTLEEENPLEKSLFLVVEKWYSLSIGRLFWILKELKEKNFFSPYVFCFKKFLEKHSSLWEILQNKDFFQKLEILIKKEIFWEKRHKGKIELNDVIEARHILIGNLEEKDCIIYTLLAYQNINF